jgi:hypothetical protein
MHFLLDAIILSLPFTSAFFIHPVSSDQRLHFLE